jgi:hypothetical protein
MCFCKYFSCFKFMLQVLHLVVAKLNLMLLMLQMEPTCHTIGAPPSRHRCLGGGSGGGVSSPRTGSGDTGDVWAAQATAWVRAKLSAGVCV